jgi:hypothetical protein
VLPGCWRKLPNNLPPPPLLLLLLLLLPGWLLCAGMSCSFASAQIVLTRL